MKKTHSLKLDDNEKKKVARFAEFDSLIEAKELLEYIDKLITLAYQSGISEEGVCKIDYVLS